MSSPPNILVILTDQQSASAMSCAGNPYLRTPAMDRLAERGVRFTDAYTTFPLCTPSRGSMWTGLMPHQHGAVHVRGEHGRLRRELLGRSIGHLFTEAGYRCGYGGKWHVGDDGPECGIDAERTHGFDRVCGFDDRRLPDACAGFLRAAASDRRRPFLLVASFDDPHNICEWAHDASLPWGNLPAPPAEPDCPPLPANFAREPYQPQAVRRWYEELQGYGFDTEMSVADWRRYRWAYFRLIERVDARVGLVLDALDANDLTDRTLVVFASDHGDMAGAHGLQQKDVLYDEAARVPFIIAGPGFASSAVCTEVVSQGLDLLPTLLDAARVDLPGGLPGMSLLPLLADPADSLDRDSIMLELCPPPNNQGVFSRGARGVRSSRFKYVVYDKGRPAEQLFDLRRDPGETVNLAMCGEHRDQLFAHREMLRRWMRETGDGFRSTHYGFTVRGTGPMLNGDEYPIKRG